MTKKGGHRSRGLRVGKYINAIFKIFGLTVAASPAITAVSQNYSNPAGIPAAVGENYSGVNISTGTFSWQKALAGIAAVLVGVGLAKLGSFLGRRF